MKEQPGEQLLAVEDDRALRARVGPYLYRQRLNIQRYHLAQIIGQGQTLLHPENIVALGTTIRVVLKTLGLYAWGNRQARRIRVMEDHAALQRLPADFAGYRILHLSDLHLDVGGGVAEAIRDTVAPLAYDLCVITGDFRSAVKGPYDDMLAQTARLMEVVHGPVYGVLGNHDCLELVPHLESMGIRLLMNENMVVERNGSRLFIAGIDDPHFYETDNLEKALAGIPEDGCTVLLSHTAEPYRQALAAGVALMLSGHTHAGQICLPGGIALFNNAKHPRSMLKGPWQRGALRGYTSSGAGSCMVPVRFFAPPEVTLHILAPAAQDTQ